MIYKHRKNNTIIDIIFLYEFITQGFTKDPYKNMLFTIIHSNHLDLRIFPSKNSIYAQDIQTKLYTPNNVGKKLLNQLYI